MISILNSFLCVDIEYCCERCHKPYWTRVHGMKTHSHPPRNQNFNAPNSKPTFTSYKNFSV